MPKRQERNEQIRQFILEKLEDHPSDITNLVSGSFDISRQASHRYVQKMISDGLVIAEGNTRDRKYYTKPLAEFSIELPLAGLEEDKVWREHIRPLMNDLSRNIFDIYHYGFTEMLNNAIDHSEGTQVTILVNRWHNSIDLGVVDNGVGIFAKLQKTLKLDDATHALLELAKGKLTSDPARHSGEGIFFTSRMFDRFFIDSGHLYYAHFENNKSDIWLEHKTDETIGTSIRMIIGSNSKRTTQEVFDNYSDDEFGFSKTQVPVFLAAYGEENLVSRSQAKRLLARLEKFKEIQLDFKDVPSIGQAFADEVFRVFVNRNPAVLLIPVNANEQVQKMIAHVKNAT